MADYRQDEAEKKIFCDQFVTILAFFEKWSQNLAYQTNTQKDKRHLRELLNV